MSENLLVISENAFHRVTYNLEFYNTSEDRRFYCPSSISPGSVYQNQEILHRTREKILNALNEYPLNPVSQNSEEDLNKCGNLRSHPPCLTVTYRMFQSISLGYSMEFSDSLITKILLSALKLPWSSAFERISLVLVFNFSLPPSNSNIIVMPQFQIEM
jgi:hypothetical protein